MSGPRALRVTALVHAALAVAFLGLMQLDASVVDGAPAWLKPFKFAASLALFSATLAWLLPELRSAPAVTRWLPGLAIAVSFIELFAIALQAGRGRLSHFNLVTWPDFAIYAVMGVAIFSLWGGLVALARAAWREPFEHPVLGDGIRFGLVLTCVGALVGAAMSAPRSAQLEQAFAEHRLVVMGSHVVGASSGEAALPVTGWSRDRGDLRVPHFLGLHALQVLPLAAWWLSRRRTLDVASARRAVRVVAALYAVLLAATFVQALLGRPLVPQPRLAAVSNADAKAVGMVAATGAPCGRSTHTASCWPTANLSSVPSASSRE